MTEVAKEFQSRKRKEDKYKLKARASKILCFVSTRYRMLSETGVSL